MSDASTHHKAMGLSAPIFKYALDHTLREHEAQVQTRDVTSNLRGARMQIAPDQGQLMQVRLPVCGT